MALQITSYHTINGRIRSERSPSPQPNHDYMQDALGSVTQTTNPSGGSVWMKQRYHGYGTRAFTSASSVRQPNYQWVGAWGYRRTARWRSDVDVRRRKLSVPDSRWTTIDPLWPFQPANVYATSRPTVLIDPRGMAANSALQGLGQVFEGILGGGTAGGEEGAEGGTFFGRRGQESEPLVAASLAQ